MSPLILRIFNQYVGGSYTLAQAAAYVGRMRVLPIPERLSLDDWRAHVPMPLLEGWAKLTDAERITVYVMGESSTHPFECMTGSEDPVMN